MRRTKMKLAGAVLGMSVLAMTGCGSSADATMDQAKVTLCDSYTGIEVEISDPAVTDEEVTEYAQTVLYYYNQQQIASRTVIEDKDTVSARVVFVDENGETLEDGSSSTGFITIGSGQTYEELEQGLIGAEVGKEIEIPVTLPDPYEFNEELSGRTITAKVTPEYIKETEEATLDTLTDEQAAAALEGVSTTEEFYDKIRTMLGDIRDEEVRQESYNGICEYLLANCTVDPVPGAEIKERTDRAVEQAKEVCQTYYGLTYEEYLEQLGHTEQEYWDDIYKTQEETVKLELIFTAIADKEGIQYEEADYQEYIQSVLDSFTYENEDELYAQYSEEYVRSAFRIEKTADWLIGQADMVFSDDLSAADGAR